MRTSFEPLAERTALMTLYPLQADAALLNVGATVTNAVISF
jgi:hypothetical protein